MIYDKLLYSECIQKSCVIELPEYSGKVFVHISVEKGNPEISFNQQNKKPCLKLYEGARWNIKAENMNIQKLYVTLKENEKIWVYVEKL